MNNNKKKYILNCFFSLMFSERKKKLALEPYFELVCEGFLYILWLSLDAIFPHRDACKWKIFLKTYNSSLLIFLTHPPCLYTVFKKGNLILVSLV